jgi:membrane associated rhomboid family serine protease
MLMTRWVTRLLIANVAVFLLQNVRSDLTGWLAFIPALALERPWTLVTYMFVHGDWGHIFFNMLALFFFGPQLEHEMGSRNFVQLYFFSGLMGAALSVLMPFSAIIGASGAVYGVMMGFAYLWPRAPIYVWGILPVQARTMVIIMTALSIYGGLGGGDNIAHFAHLGGFLGGFLYLRWWIRRLHTPMTEASPVQFSNDDLRRWESIPREGMHEVNRAELERILAKIRTEGPGRLTSGEIEFLNRFSQT